MKEERKAGQGALSRRARACRADRGAELQERRPTPTSSATPGSCSRWSSRRCRRRMAPLHARRRSGSYDFDGKLVGAMTAHPKMDPETGEMLFFGYAPFPPYLQYHVVDRDGRARAQRGDRRRVAVDDARLRDHQGPRRLHPLPDRVQLREDRASAAASSPGSPSAAPASASCRAAAATPTCAGSTPTRATSSTR